MASFVFSCRWYRFRARCATLPWAIFLVPVCLLLSACGGEKEVGGGSKLEAYVPVVIGGQGDVFDPNRLLQVEITMAEAHYNALRAEGRTLAEGARECVPDYDYTRFPAIVTIDGETMADVNLRKKGFIGSLSLKRPSFIMYFDDLYPGRTYQGVSRMTLNNNRQDAAVARQCMAYALFEKAGVRAPRCTFARVSVNGEDLGVYTHVEPLRDPFLRRAFGSDQGNLYEAQTSDFGVYLSDSLEKKNFRRANDRSDLEAVNAVMQLDDDAFLDALPQLVNVDYFIRFWAMETLLGLWDSASGNANNYYFFRNPQDQLFYFIPWGADVTFTFGHSLLAGSGPLFRNFSIAHRLFNIPQQRQIYIDTLREYLEDIWNEQALLDELARIRELTGISAHTQRHVIDFIQGNPRPHDNPDSPITRQREVLENALDHLEANPDNYDESIIGRARPLEDKPRDCSPPGTSALTGTVTSRPGGSFQFTTPSGEDIDTSLIWSLNLLPGTRNPMVSIDEVSDPSVFSLTYVGQTYSVFNGGYRIWALQLFIESSQFVDGTYGLQGFSNSAVVVSVPGLMNLSDISLVGIASGGTFTLEGAEAFLASGGDSNDFRLTLDMTMEYVDMSLNGGGIP